MTATATVKTYGEFRFGPGLASGYILLSEIYDRTERSVVVATATTVEANGIDGNCGKS